MARLVRMPAQIIIDGFKGVVDYYVCRGQPCARKWPHWRPRKSTPEELANQEDFSYITKVTRSLQPSIIEQYQRMAVSTPFTWRDLAIRAYMHGLW